MGPNWLTFDLEIQDKPEDLPGGWSDKAAMKVSVAVVYEHAADRFRVYGPDDLDVLRRRLLEADRITTFNGDNFDYPVLFGKGWPSAACSILPKSDDLFARVRRADAACRAHEKGWRADDVGRATLGRGKTGDGAEAPGLWKAGRWAALVDYCIADVALERDLALFADRYGYLLGGRPPRRVPLPAWKGGAL